MFEGGCDTSDEDGRLRRQDSRCNTRTEGRDSEDERRGKHERAAIACPQDFVFSGFTPEEERALAAWPESARQFAYFHHLPGPLHVADLSVYVHALGIEPAPMFSRSFQGTPMRNRGAAVGSFFLADKADGEAFTEADEATLVLFAQQAAAALADARVHRQEQRTRAGLEALVETCPVGVVVLDAAGGAPVSLNREARRILAEFGEAAAPPVGCVSRWSAGAATDARSCWATWRAPRQCGPRRWRSPCRAGPACAR